MKSRTGALNYAKRLLQQSKVVNASYRKRHFDDRSHHLIVGINMST